MTKMTRIHPLRDKRLELKGKGLEVTLKPIRISQLSLLPSILNGETDYRMKGSTFRIDLESIIHY